MDLEGVFTSAQAREQGWTWRDISRRRSAETLHELATGVFIHELEWNVLSAKHQHLALVRARILSKRRAWHAARRSAALAHGLPLIGTRPPALAQLLRDPGGGKSQGHSRHERIAELPESECVVVNGLPTTSLALTVIHMAREEAFRNAVVAADGALRRGMTKEQLLTMARKHGSQPGGLTALAVAQFADGLAESALESISRVACVLVGLPVPELQIKVMYAGECVARVDGLWREFNVIGQADGALKYQEKGADRVLADKWQDEKLESLGFEVARWGWDTAWRPTSLGVVLRRAFERGARQRIDPGVTLVQATLEECLAVQHTRAS
jgi:hypothetical protein